MENLMNLLNLFNQKTSEQSEPHKQEIPKEVLDQYPYGDFPIRYTKAGQENIRKNSENRFSYTTPQQPSKQPDNNANLNLSSLLPLIQLMSQKQQPKDMMKILSKLLFKDNKDIQKVFDLISIKSKEIDKSDNFPDLNKVNISSLKRVE